MWWCVTESMFLLTFWCLLWYITEQTQGNVESICFIDYNEETNYKTSFNITWKPASECPLWQTQKTHNTLLSIQNDAISLVAMHSKTIIVIGPRKSCHCQLGSSRATRGMKAYSKRSQFLSSELKSLDVCLEYCRS